MPRSLPFSTEPDEPRHRDGEAKPHRSFQSRIRSGWRPYSLVMGLAAAAWLILRSGEKPSRLAYPCQRAALGSAWAALGVPLAYAALKTFRTLKARSVPLATAGLVMAALALTAFVGTNSSPSYATRVHLLPPEDYRAAVYALEHAAGPGGDHHLGLDDLIACMGSQDFKFYRSDVVGPESGPDGVVGPSDLVLVKVNLQWDQRGGTNTDVLKGLIARILEHPDGFTGEVVVGENTAGWGSFDWEYNNAEDHGQSVMDVVHHFADAGHAVSAYVWDDLRYTSVGEYFEGDINDGYVVLLYDPQTQIAVSYPKFQTAGGRYVSLARGIWDSETEEYDDSEFTFINLPVLKCHGYQYGVTASCKHHVGTMTTYLQTNTHNAVEFGGLGRFLADVRLPDLNIIDAIYILAHPSGGPWCAYEEATRLDKLAAGIDPVALDMWVTINFLIPAIEANGYTSYPMQDPHDPGSIFRVYLDNTMDVLLAEGIEVTNDPDQIDAFVCQGTGVESDDGDESFDLTADARPNPFSVDTAIRFQLAEPVRARLDIHDVTGRRVRSLQVRGFAGANEVVWDGRDDRGKRAAPGIYLYRLEAGRLRAAGRLLRIG